MSDCVICQYFECDPRGKPLVPNPSIENISSILKCASDRLLNGEFLLKPLVDFLESLTTDDLKELRYHSHCRKKVEHSHKAKAVGIVVLTVPALQREVDHLKSDPLTSPARAVRNPAHKPKEKICVFSPCNFERDDLLQVKSDSRGRKLIDIKNSTTDDKVRTCLSTLVDPGDASAQEIWYHKYCIVYAERTCIMDYNNTVLCMQNEHV